MPLSKQVELLHWFMRMKICSIARSSLQVTALATLLENSGLTVGSTPDQDMRPSPSPPLPAHQLHHHHSLKSLNVHPYTPGPTRLRPEVNSGPLPHLHASSSPAPAVASSPPPAPAFADMQIELLDVCSLFQPSVDLFIKNLGKRLQEWVDKTVGTEMSREEGSRWTPVSLLENNFYSFSVIELYRHLTVVLEQVSSVIRFLSG